VSSQDDVVSVRRVLMLPRVQANLKGEEVGKRSDQPVRGLWVEQCVGGRCAALHCSQSAI
jgi:hypothetical protein